MPLVLKINASVTLIVPHSKRKNVRVPPIRESYTSSCVKNSLGNLTNAKKIMLSSCLPMHTYSALDHLSYLKSPNNFEGQKLKSLVLFGGRLVW